MKILKIVTNDRFIHLNVTLQCSYFATKNTGISSLILCYYNLYILPSALKVSFESVDNSTNTGKVVIKTKGLTLQPCAQFWSQAASKQLCINQGFKTGVTFGLPSADNSLNVTELPVWLWNNTCNSTTRGSNCLTSGKAVQTCTDTSSVAVFCSNNGKKHTHF